MATVRFSDKLKDEINKKARKMFDKELDKAKADIPSTWNAEYLYNLMFDKDIRDKMNALPKNFMGTTQQITFRGFKNLPQGEYDRFCSISLSVQHRLLVLYHAQLCTQR